MSKNKSIHTCIYDMQKIHKESYVDGIMIWVPVNTDGLRQTLIINTHLGKRLFAVNKLIHFHKKKYTIHYSIIL